jgi:hypothetical protein
MSCCNASSPTWVGSGPREPPSNFHAYAIAPDIASSNFSCPDTIPLPQIIVPQNLKVTAINLKPKQDIYHRQTLIAAPCFNAEAPDTRRTPFLHGVRTAPTYRCIRNPDPSLRRRGDLNYSPSVGARCTARGGTPPIRVLHSTELSPRGPD